MHKNQLVWSLNQKHSLIKSIKSQKKKQQKGKYPSISSSPTLTWTHGFVLTRPPTEIYLPPVHILILYTKLICRHTNGWSAFTFCHCGIREKRKNRQIYHVLVSIPVRNKSTYMCALPRNERFSGVTDIPGTLDAWTSSPKRHTHNRCRVRITENWKLWSFPVSPWNIMVGD